MLKQIEKIIATQIKPVLAQHGGDIEIIDIDSGKLFIKFLGGCQGCSSSSATLKQGVEKILAEKFPQITEVIDLTNHDAGNNPYM